MNDHVKRRNTILIVLVASLGYFVDIYDLILFSVVRVKSLTDLGVSEDDMLRVGATIINSQMFGMLVGGILWGVLGDKKGRLSVLFGSIITYSLANIANGFVTSVDQYAIVRFIGGVGLAGELGAGITLVTETMSKKNRGYGTMIVAAVGLLGAVMAALISARYTWQTSYFIGGGMGLLLLTLRIGLVESGMFKEATDKNVQRGNLLMLFNNWSRFKKYVCCILIGLPLWYVVGVLITFSPEFGRALNATGIIDAGKGIMYCYIGISIGDVVAGLLAQVLKSRKKVMLIFILLTTIVVGIYLNSFGLTPEGFILLSLLLGFASGYWATFVTIAAEQFGTNLRATVTTTVPNFVRGSLVAVTLGFQFFKDQIGILGGAMLVGAITIVIALLALSQLKESFGKDLDYVEE
ncbi:MFS transporter [Sphingobacterium corticibacter]|uniref:MFS transporter n=1 Tax=Sphingobacterium corticibacter TaxID=2171749 RepID=A0A2T8HMB3_9SPHI|nr:MFS transporter [Sphingobacterium corticibacter]PVH26588.1 MFS transporter [Sphingobacterium corticibacter]